jgi:hypothetical protein
MNVKKKEPVIEAIQFTGKNWEELKDFAPHLEKFTAEKTGRKEHEYTVGWTMNDPLFPGSFSEALPGWYIIKENGVYKIYDEPYFKTQFE